MTEENWMTGSRTYATGAVPDLLRELADAQAENRAIRSSHADCEADMLHTIAELKAALEEHHEGMTYCAVCRPPEPAEGEPGYAGRINALRAALGEEAP